MIFPAPLPQDLAEQLESLATDLHIAHPHKTRIECREFAAVFTEWMNS